MLLSKMDVNVAFDGACQTSFCVPSCSFLFWENNITGYFKVPNDSMYMYFCQLSIRYVQIKVSQSIHMLSIQIDTQIS